MDGAAAPPPSHAKNPDLIYTGMHIFVQASGVGTDRPKFIRTLKERGASTCSILSDAQVILINPDSEEGQALIPPWSNLTEPKLLTMDWVQKCNSAGRLLLAEDDWGGCLVKYDRTHRDDDDDDWEEDEADIASKSPLPTPRQTPSEPTGTQPWLAGSVTQSSATRARRTSSQTRLSTSSTTPTDSATVTPTDLPQNGLPSFPAFSSVNSMQALPTQFPVQMAGMFNPLMTADQQAMAMLQMMMPNPAFQMALQDIMTRGNPASQMQPGRTVYRHSNRLFKNKSYHFLTCPPNHREGMSTISVLQDLSLPLPARGGSPSVKRRKTLSSSQQVTHLKQSTASAAGPSSSQTKLFAKSGKVLSFFVQIDLHNRGAVVDAIKKNAGKIEKDPENADYAVLYSGHKNQKTFNDLLKSAQTAGKPAVRSAFVHDCVAEGILLDCTEYEFESTVKRKRKPSVPVKTEPLSSNDEIDSDAERKRLAKNAREAERRKRQRSDKERAAKPTSSKSSTASRVKAEEPSTLRRKESINIAPYLNGRRSPIPPGEHTRQPWSTGYKFTVEEDQFLIEYAQVLIERDYMVSIAAIADRVYSKMPHHSLMSWKSRVTRVIGDKLDEWRKRSGIAYRKALKASQSAHSQPMALDASVDDTAVIELSPSPEPLAAQDAHALSNLNDMTANDPESILRNENKTYVTQDIEVVSQFFATLDDDGEEPEDVVWARLANQNPCRAWHDWAAFYEAHFQEVQQRYAELTGNAQLQ
ncbi:hypothetical protein CPB84DRAFT_1771647 [Gymnopilus junonius]|uniref:BRCT domain-containing protein n=1 Tax=Gymnopilus junonius TaxID=109634 RepID=A0A9P5NV11_GYMJU|nr:hypothetical protein CPB84DRAFT_1771647 [Gymnopilus junonius]